VERRVGGTRYGSGYHPLLKIAAAADPLPSFAAPRRCSFSRSGGAGDDVVDQVKAVGLMARQTAMLLRPYPTNLMRALPGRERVCRVRNNDPALLDPLLAA
jgi:hypothetical protein